MAILRDIIRKFKQNTGSITITVMLLILSIFAIILFVGFDYPKVLSDNWFLL